MPVKNGQEVEECLIQEQPFPPLHLGRVVPRRRSYPIIDPPADWARGDALGVRRCSEYLLHQPCNFSLCNFDRVSELLIESKGSLDMVII